VEEPGSVRERAADAAASAPPSQSLRQAWTARQGASGGAVDRDVPAAPPLDDDAADRVARTRQGGRPLPDAVRRPAETRFGFDFGSVRVHDDSAGADAAAALDARAYTIGRDVGFAPGQFAPETPEGQALLAHELTHVAQQAAAATAPSTVFRAAHDFQIRGKSTETEPTFIFFRENSHTLDAAEQAKVDALKLPASDMLTLHGYSSEEGAAADNVTTANARLDAVVARLTAAPGPHDPAKITRLEQSTRGQGVIDYRHMRSVEIVPPGGSSRVPPAPVTAPCAGADETAFVTGKAAADALIDASTTELGGAIGATMTSLLTRFFGGVAAAPAVRTNLIAIKAQLARLLPAGNHQCANSSVPACASSDAENRGTGAGAMMTLCPGFLGEPSVKKRGGTLIHEAAHGTPGVATHDHAYAHERRIEFLSPAEALANSDSYTLLVRLFDTPGSMTAGPAVADTLTGMTGPEETAAKRTVAWLERWLIWAYQDMSDLYDAIRGTIAAGAWTRLFEKATMALVAPRFGLTAPPALPTFTDQVRVAAIHDRYHLMRETMHSSPITIHKVAAGTETWAAGPGASVNVGPAFFGDTPRHQLDRLLRAIVHATPDIGGPLETQYVLLTDEIRTHRGGGAP
jgi:hypothetical protein